MAEISMPTLGYGMEEGTVSAWFKKEGDAVTEGDAIVEVETDKAVVEIGALETGTLTKILVQVGETVLVGVCIGIIDSEETPAKAGNGLTSPELYIHPQENSASQMTGRDVEMIANHIRDLQDEHGVIRISAARKLGEIGDTTAVPDLIEALREELEVDKWGKALGMAKGSVAVRSALDDLYYNSICDPAIHALGQIGDPSAVPILIEALRKFNSTAADALEKIGTPAIPALLEVMKDREDYPRRHAAEVLIKIRASSAIPALIMLLKDNYSDSKIFSNAARVLWNLGDVSAIPVFIDALKAEDEWVRSSAALGLCYFANVSAYITDVSAVPALIDAIKDKSKHVRSSAARALKRIGDADTLPRKILVVSQSSPQDRIELLEKLRRVRYRDEDISLRYKFPDTRALCQMVLNEQNAAAREGAQSVLDWINDGSKLLRASQADTTKQSGELVRPTYGGDPETKPETLLRASDEQRKDVDVPPKQATVWQRLFGKPADRVPTTEHQYCRICGATSPLGEKQCYKCQANL